MCRIHAFTRHRAGKAVGFIQKTPTQVKSPMHRQRNRQSTQPAVASKALPLPDKPVFKSCRLSLEIEATQITDAPQNSVNASRNLRFCLVRHQAAGFANQQQHQRNDNDRDDAHTRNRAGRRTDQTGHITASRGHQKPIIEASSVHTTTNSQAKPPEICESPIKWKKDTPNTSIIANTQAIIALGDKSCSGTLQSSARRRNCGKTGAYPRPSVSSKSTASK